MIEPSLHAGRDGSGFHLTRVCAMGAFHLRTARRWKRNRDLRLDRVECGPTSGRNREERRIEVGHSGSTCPVRRRICGPQESHGGQILGSRDPGFVADQSLPVIACRAPWAQVEAPSARRVTPAKGKSCWRPSRQNHADLHGRLHPAKPPPAPPLRFILVCRRCDQATGFNCPLHARRINRYLPAAPSDLVVGSR